MSTVHDHSRDHSFAQRRRRDKALKKISDLHAEYSVVELTPYQIRINGMLDIYPTGQKWHNIITGERGMYNDPAEICREQIKKETHHAD